MGHHSAPIFHKSFYTAVIQSAKAETLDVSTHELSTKFQKRFPGVFIQWRAGEILLLWSSLLQKNCVYMVRGISLLLPKISPRRAENITKASKAEYSDEEPDSAECSAGAQISLQVGFCS